MVAYIPDDTYRSIVESVPILCVDLVISNTEGQTLLVKRANDPLKGEWFIPGGRVLRGETIQSAVTRKGREELSVDLIRPVFIGFYQDFYPGVHTVSLVYQCGWSGDIKLDSQATEWKWGKLPERIKLE